MAQSKKKTKTSKKKTAKKQPAKRKQSKRAPAKAVQSIINKNKVKSVIYEVFGAKQSANTIYSKAVEAGKKILMPSMYRSLFDSHTAREAQLVSLALQQLIKTTGNTKPKNEIEELCMRLKDKLAVKHNKSLCMEYSTEELARMD